MRILQERSSPARYEDSLVDLFDAVADAFAELLLADNHFAFKYCPTPGCSVDTATGSLESGGLACAVMTKLGFPGKFLFFIHKQQILSEKEQSHYVQLK